MTIRITETAISRSTRESAESGKLKELGDAGCPGLRLRITPAGSKSWVLACRDRTGRMRRFGLGSYPDKGLSEARTEARQLHYEVRHRGADPIAEARRERAIGQAARAGIATLGAILDLYGQQAAPKSWAHGRLRVGRVFKAQLPLVISQITLADLQLVADAYPTPKSAAFAVRTIRPALKWASAPGRKYLPAEWAGGLASPAPRGRRSRVLSREELAKLLPVLCRGATTLGALRRFSTVAGRTEAARMRWRHVDLRTRIWSVPAAPRKGRRPQTITLTDEAIALLATLPRGQGDEGIFGPASPYAAAMLLMLLTLARREEVAAARWQEFDLGAGTWSIPAERAKNAQQHIVPLPQQAMQLLAELGPGEPDDLVFASATGSPMANWDRETKSIQAGSSTTGWHRHDLRRTGATMLGDMGELPEIIEAALNHTSIRSPLAATYNRACDRPQVAIALQRLADALDGIKAGAANVVSLRQAG